jgi:hypothetical protein
MVSVIVPVHVCSAAKPGVTIIKNALAIKGSFCMSVSSG